LKLDDDPKRKDEEDEKVTDKIFTPVYQLSSLATQWLRRFSRFMHLSMQIPTHLLCCFFILSVESVYDVTLYC
jgi:hypothetical protein